MIAVNVTNNGDGTYTYPDTLVIHLFNLTDDLEETTNIKDMYPDTVDDLLRRLAEFSDTRVALLPSCTDFRSAPMYHNGTWSPWIEPGEDWEFGFGCSGSVGDEWSPGIVGSGAACIFAWNIGMMVWALMTFLYIKH